MFGRSGVPREASSLTRVRGSLGTAGTCIVHGSTDDLPIDDNVLPRSRSQSGADFRDYRNPPQKPAAALERAGTSGR